MQEIERLSLRIQHGFGTPKQAVMERSQNAGLERLNDKQIKKIEHLHYMTRPMGIK
jgi:hypothetical protein